MSDPETRPLRFTVSQCLGVLGVSRGHFYKQVKAGVYQVIKDGRRTFMTREQLDNAIQGIGPDDPDRGEYWAQNDNDHVWRIGHIGTNHHTGKRCVVFYQGSLVHWLPMPEFKQAFTNAALRKPWLPEKDQ